MTAFVRLVRAPSGRLVLPLVAVLAVLIGACGGGSSGANASPVATTTVDLPPSYRFVPAAITVPTGSTVTWTNHDNFTHSVRLAGAEPLAMAPGESVTHTFATPGVFHYDCSLHPKDMQGSVLVTGG
jgi:plastocyanin